MVGLVLRPRACRASVQGLNVHRSNVPAPNPSHQFLLNVLPGSLRTEPRPRPTGNRSFGQHVPDENVPESNQALTRTALCKRAYASVIEEAA